MIQIINKNRTEDKERIVITGIGVVSPIGIGKEAFWQGLKEGRSGIKPVTLFDTSTTRSKLAGEITDFKPEEILGPKGLRNLDRTTLLALCAAKLALDDANFQVTEENTDDVGVVLGSTMGSVWSISEFDKEFIRGGLRAVNPGLFPNTVINAPASQISIWFKIKGFNSTLSSGFTSSLDALEYARNFLLIGRAKAVLVGGVEELCEQMFKGCYKLGFLAGSQIDQKELCAPFDARRNGAVVGEGAAVFLMETQEAAQKRGSKIYGSIGALGSAFDRDCHYRYSLKANGLKKAIGRALNISEKDPEDIEYISSSANSTVAGDYSEAKAIKSLYSKEKGVVVSAVRSMIGESFSAGGAFQVASALFSINSQCVSPTINYKEEDERCLLDCVPNQSRSLKVNNVLVVNSSPMGRNSAVVLSGAGCE